MNYKLLITTSGTGSRLGDLTKNTNKALIKLGGKEIISHIIDSYSKDIDIVVTLGYYGDKVKLFLDKKYNDRKIEYAYVDKYEGIGSSLGYSMLCAKDKLQCPFIFHCNDTIVNAYEPSVGENRAGGYRVQDATQYTTFKTAGKYINFYNEKKGALDYDYAHIGLIGVYEYEKYWNIIENFYKEDPNNSALNDVYVLKKMLGTGSKIGFIEFKQRLDTGNLNSLKESQQKFII